MYPNTVPGEYSNEEIRKRAEPLQLAIKSTTYHILDLLRHVLNTKVKFRDSNRDVLFSWFETRRLGEFRRTRGARLGRIGFTGEDRIRVFIRVEVGRGEGGVVCRVDNLQVYAQDIMLKDTHQSCPKPKGGRCQS